MCFAEGVRGKGKNNPEPIKLLHMWQMHARRWHGKNLVPPFVGNVIAGSGKIILFKQDLELPVQQLQLNEQKKKTPEAPIFVTRAVLLNNNASSSALQWEGGKIFPSLVLPNSNGNS